MMSLETINMAANIARTMKSELVPWIVKPERKQLRKGADSSAKNRNHANAYPQRPVWIADICPITIVIWWNAASQSGQRNNTTIESIAKYPNDHWSIIFCNGLFIVESNSQCIYPGFEHSTNIKYDVNINMDRAWTVDRTYEPLVTLRRDAQATRRMVANAIVEIITLSNSKGRTGNSIEKFSTGSVCSWNIVRDVASLVNAWLPSVHVS